MYWVVAPKHHTWCTSWQKIEQKKKLRPFADFCARFADFLRSVCGLGFCNPAQNMHEWCGIHSQPCMQQCSILGICMTCMTDLDHYKLCMTDLKMAVHAWCHIYPCMQQTERKNPQTERKKSANRAQKIRKPGAKIRKPSAKIRKPITKTEHIFHHGTYMHIDHACDWTRLLYSTTNASSATTSSLISAANWLIHSSHESGLLSWGFATNSKTLNTCHHHSMDLLQVAFQRSHGHSVHP